MGRRITNMDYFFSGPLRKWGSFFLSLASDGVYYFSTVDDIITKARLKIGPRKFVSLEIKFV